MVPPAKLHSPCQEHHTNVHLGFNQSSIHLIQVLLNVPKKNSKPLSVVCVVIWFWILDFDSHCYSLTTKLNPFSDWLISTSIVSTLSPCLHSEVIIFSTIFSNLLSWSFILGLLGSFSFVTTFFMWVFHGQPPEHPKNSLIYDLIQIIHGSMTQFFACLVKHPIM